MFILFLFLSSCSLDNFLFNSEKLEKYSLPNNNIPDSLLEQINLKSEGSNIYGYWVKSNSINKTKTILYFHGNRHSIDEYWDRVITFHEMGFNVFIFDYRGYGMSEGENSEDNLYKDAETALDFVIKTKNIPNDSICIYGYSLGNVPAIYLCANKINPFCLISESPFATANTLTQGSIGLDIPPYWLTKGNFNNIEAIKKIKIPFLLLHGENDDFVRYVDNGKLVYDNAPNPKKLMLIPNANHTNIRETLGIEKYKQILSDFINNK